MNLHTRAPWLVTMSDEPDPEFAFRLGPMNVIEGRKGSIFSSPSDVVRDVYEVEERVNQVNGAEDALRLFEEFGPWQIGEPYATEGLPIRLSSVLKQRDRFARERQRSVAPGERIYAAQRRNLVEGLEDLWMYHPLPFELVLSDPPFAQVRSKDIQDALRAACFMRQIQRGRWGKCAKASCGKFFKKPADKKPSVYCSKRCASAESSNKYNERKRKLAQANLRTEDGK